jgi:HD-GYP domain-containing protein (c-di-GMP phosphodiesterase class II)
VAIADAFDALTHARPYKAAWKVADAVAEIKRQRGHKFDPLVVDAFLGMLLEDGAIEALGEPGAEEGQVGPGRAIDPAARPSLDVGNGR